MYVSLATIAHKSSPAKLHTMREPLYIRGMFIYLAKFSWANLNPTSEGSSYQESRKPACSTGLQPLESCFQLLTSCLCCLTNLILKCLVCFGIWIPQGDKGAV